MKELTLKQLYGYSIMNWELYLGKLENAENEKNCSFCRDVGRRDDEYGNLGCEDCKINSTICNHNENSSVFSGIYGEFCRKFFGVNSGIQKIIDALKNEYNKL